MPFTQQVRLLFEQALFMQGHRNAIIGPGLCAKASFNIVVGMFRRWATVAVLPEDLPFLF